MKPETNRHADTDGNPYRRNPKQNIPKQHAALSHPPSSSRLRHRGVCGACVPAISSRHRRRSPNVAQGNVPRPYYDKTNPSNSHCDHQSPPFSKNAISDSTIPHSSTRREEYCRYLTMAHPHPYSVSHHHQLHKSEVREV
jgi:hypothetical protein